MKRLIGMGLALGLTSSPVYAAGEFDFLQGYTGRWQQKSDSFVANAEVAAEAAGSYSIKFHVEYEFQRTRHTMSDVFLLRNFKDIPLLEVSSRPASGSLLFDFPTKRAVLVAHEIGAARLAFFQLTTPLSEVGSKFRTQRVEITGGQRCPGNPDGYSNVHYKSDDYMFFDGA